MQDVKVKEQAVEVAKQKLDLADFALPYPLVEIDGKPVSRLFVQRDALPTPSGPSSQAFRVHPTDNR